MLRQSKLSDKAKIGVTSVAFFGIVIDRISGFDHGLGQGLSAVYDSAALWFNDDIVKDLIFTLSRVTIGFCIATILGISIGLMTGPFQK